MNNEQSKHATALDTQALIKNWQSIIDKIQRSQTDAQRQEAVRLIAVSKTKPVEMITALYEAGQTDFGENYLQEALPKIQALASMPNQPAICWHYIGHIQRNKTRDITENFDWVHTIERDIIAKRLNSQRPDSLPNLNVLIQVNIDNEPNKSGCLPSDVANLVAKIKEYERLTLRGLMIIPQQQTLCATQSGSAFARTKALFEQIKQQYPSLQHWDTLSMGMSADMQEAIAQGATMVRVGSAIFGAREAL